MMITKMYQVAIDEGECDHLQFIKTRQFAHLPCPWTRLSRVASVLSTWVVGRPVPDAPAILVDIIKSVMLEII